MIELEKIIVGVNSQYFLQNEVLLILRLYFTDKRVHGRRIREMQIGDFCSEEDEARTLAEH